MRTHAIFPRLSTCHNRRHADRRGRVCRARRQRALGLACKIFILHAMWKKEAQLLRLNRLLGLSFVVAAHLREKRASCLATAPTLVPSHAVSVEPRPCGVGCTAREKKYRAQSPQGGKIQSGGRKRCTPPAGRYRMTKDAIRRARAAGLRGSLSCSEVRQALMQKQACLLPADSADLPEGAQCLSARLHTGPSTSLALVRACIIRTCRTRLSHSNWFDQMPT